MPLGAARCGILGAAGGGEDLPLTAFGGIITQYTDGGTTYRVHTFRGSGSFEVSSGSADVDYLIVAGGGSSGGLYYGAPGGGGAGGMITGTGVTVSAASSPYTVSIGAGYRNGSLAI